MLYMRLAPGSLAIPEQPKLATTLASYMEPCEDPIASGGPIASGSPPRDLDLSAELERATDEIAGRFSQPAQSATELFVRREGALAAFAGGSGTQIRTRPESLDEDA